MKNSLIRVLISLFLCCCLVLNVAAMPARASSFGSWLLHQIGTDIGVTGILEGLGLFRDTLNGDEYYNNLVSDVKDYLANTGQITGDYIDAYWRIDPLNANPVLTIPLALISAVRQYLFDNAVVTDSYSGISNSRISALNDAVLNYETAFAFSNPYCIFYQLDNGDLMLGCAKYPFILGTDGLYRSSNNGASQSIKIYTVSSGSYYAHFGYVSEFNPDGKPVRLFRGSNPVSTYNPIILGTIAPPGTLFTSAYPHWLEHEKEKEDGTTVPMVQIGLGNTLAETESLTQEQIWSGQGTLQIPEQGQTEVTLQDILQGIIQLPGQMVTSIQTAFQTFFVPSGNIQAYSLDLKALFPFCIPFDIYDFLAALSADPVPPVFEFDLNLGVATEPMKIDLSNWSDLAAIIRTLELGLFCVGLALKTRELIGG